MSTPSPLHLVLGVAHATIAVAWAIVARDAWRQVQTQRWSHALISLLPLLSVTMAFVYFSSSIFLFIPTVRHASPWPALEVLYAANDVAVCIAVALFRHMVRFFSLREERPTRRWLLLNYGSAAVVIAFLLWCDVTDGAHSGEGVPLYAAALWTYVLVMLGLATRRLIPLARGSWTAGGFAVARRPDVVALLAGIAAVVLVVVLQLAGGWAQYRDAMSSLTTVIGVTVVTPFAVRILGEVLRGIALVYSMLAATGLVLVGAVVLDMRFSSDPGLRPLVLLLSAAALALIFGPFQSWLGHALEAVVSRRTRHRHAELQRALHDLSPELGAHECCSRALRELNRVLQLRGSCILLRDGGSVVEGELAAERLDRAWPRGEAADTLRGSPVVDYEAVLRLPYPVREALHEADAVRIVAVAGVQRSWGHLVLTTSLVGSTFGDEDTRTIAGFADHLARLLDGVELLERAIRVERSLAHAEKLAAVGELAARIAHEIRNPVTAARSLAQLLARDPTSDLNAEHADLILAELERVERQVAALLRFSRREEFHFEAVDFGDLVIEIAEAFRGRCAEAGVDVEIDAARGAWVRADREKLRQVLINLVENALDALRSSEGERRLRLELRGVDGSCAVVVDDNGPGVPDDALPRLFEPFFSLKHSGTGLGLAIVQRTVEAHGGSVAAARGDGGGMSFRVEIPFAGWRAGAGMAS
jgi:signal transduction histidine kinase